MFRGPHVKVPFILARSHAMVLEFLRQFFENPLIQIFIKILQLGVEFHTDRRKDATKPVVAFRNFAKAHKKVHILPTERIYVFCIEFSPTQH
jgi:hypothetical protein